MNRRIFLGAASGAILGAVVGCSVAPKINLQPSSVSAKEYALTIAAMKPPKRKRPVVAVLCDNRGSETTDLIIPWSVLTRSGVADVVSVSIQPGPVSLHPALKMNAQMTIAEFEKSWPDGPDYVIVPAFHNSKAPVAVEWIKQMSAGGSTIASICSGGLTVGHAGLFEGREGTTHWYSVDKLKKISPGMVWRPDRRYVADNGVISTTGVSASLPVSLALVEAIAGTKHAKALAARLGVKRFSPEHDSSAFREAGGLHGRAILNSANLLGKEKHGICVTSRTDELTLALTADAWSRTYRSKCQTIGETRNIRTLNGLDLIVDRTKKTKGLNLLDALPTKPGTSIDVALEAINARYGRPTASLVALQLEHPWVTG